MKDLSKTEWDKLANMSDDKIDYTDIPETESEFWSDAKSVLPPNKIDIQLQIDEDLANWIKELGVESDQTINYILRSYYQTLKNIQTGEFQ